MYHLFYHRFFLLLHHHLLSFLHFLHYLPNHNQKSILNKWYNLYSDKQDHNSKIDDILLDDLNTPGFIAKIHELYNAAIKGDEKKRIEFNQACRFLGLFSETKKDWESFKKSKIKVSESYILKKIEERTVAKNKGNFSATDKIFSGAEESTEPEMPPGFPHD